MGVEMGLLLPAVQCGCEDCGGCDKEELEFDFGAKTHPVPSTGPNIIVDEPVGNDSERVPMQFEADLVSFNSVPDDFFF